MPNVAVTVDSFDYASNYPDLADNKRPIWVIEQGPGAISIPRCRARSSALPAAARRPTSTPGRWARSRPGRRARSLARHPGQGRRAHRPLHDRRRSRRARQGPSRGGAIPHGQFTVTIAPRPPATHVNPNTGQLAPGAYPAAAPEPDRPEPDRVLDPLVPSGTAASAERGGLGRLARCRNGGAQISPDGDAMEPSGHYDCTPAPRHAPGPRIGPSTRSGPSGPALRRQTRHRRNRPAHAQDPSAERHRRPVERQRLGARHPRPDAAGEPGVRVERVQREPAAPPAAQARVHGAAAHARARRGAGHLARRRGRAGDEGLGDGARRDALHPLVPAADRIDGGEARLLLRARGRRHGDRRVLRQGADPGRARRLLVPDRRHPRDVRGARLHGLGPDQPGVHPGEPERRAAVHPDRVHVLDGRGAGQQDPAAALDGRAVGGGDPGAASCSTRPTARIACSRPWDPSRSTS